MTIQHPTVYIGYDPREEDAYNVCFDSMVHYGADEGRITDLDLFSLHANGMYTRNDAPGQRYIDSVANEPYSTEFSFSRFLVPRLCNLQGFAMFVDCDFMFRANMAGLFGQFDPRFAVQVVKHDFRPTAFFKMDGRIQYTYPRKVWSALMLINCEHPGWARLTVDMVNTLTKVKLQSFCWLADEEIGEITPEWHWIDGHSDINQEPAAVHFTHGVPSMAGYQNTMYAEEWRQWA